MAANKSAGGRNAGKQLTAGYIQAQKALGTTEAIFLVLAVIINLWVLVSILSSKRLRARLRNQIICGISFLHVLMALILSSIQTYNVFRRLNRWATSAHYKCHGIAYAKTMSLMESIFEDCMMVTLCLAYLAQVIDYRPSSRLKSSRVKILHAAMLLSPWVIGLVAAPPSLSLISTRGYPCFNARWPDYYIFDIIFTTIPIAAAVIILIVAIVIWHRRSRFGGGTDSGTTEAQLMGSGPKVDKPAAYIIAVGACFIFEITVVGIRLGRAAGASKSPYHVRNAAGAIQSVRAVLLPIAWLFLPDIRQRLKTWRPWRCEDSEPQTDLELNHDKETENNL